MPLVSSSKRSKRVRQAARNAHRRLKSGVSEQYVVEVVCDGKVNAYQNSSKPMVPLLFESNILIIIFTVCKSKLVQSPLTSAAPNSLSDNCPLPSLSTALNNGKSDASVALLLPLGTGVPGGLDCGGDRPWWC